MKQIWKYKLNPGLLIHMIPKNGIVLHVDEQFQMICIWVEVDSGQPLEQRKFAVYGTGHSIDDTVEQNYLGSVKLEDGNFIFHIYEIIERR